MVSRVNAKGVKDLLVEGVDVSCIDLNKQTVLHNRICEGHVEVVKHNTTCDWHKEVVNLFIIGKVNIDTCEGGNRLGRAYGSYSNGSY